VQIHAITGGNDLFVCMPVWFQEMEESCNRAAHWGQIWCG